MDSRRQALTVRLCAVLVAGLGIVAFVGWLLGNAALANFGARGVPMAPSTAVLFVLYAVAILLPVTRPSHRGSARAGVAISVAGAVVALLLLVFSLRGIRLEAEHVGAVVTHAAGAPAIGHMSPIAAACFLLVAFSYLLRFAFGANRQWLSALGLWLAALLLAIGLFLVADLPFGMLFVSAGSFIPPAAPTAVAFILLAISLLSAGAASTAQHEPAPHPADADDHLSSSFVAIVAVAFALVATLGRLNYQGYAQHVQTSAQDELSAITALKIAGLADWRAERVGDATMFFENQVFASLVQRWFDHPGDSATEHSLRDWIASIQTSYPYGRISLVDSKGVRRLSVPKTTEPLEDVVLRQALEAQRSGKVTFVDFYREGQRPVYLAMVAPIVSDRSRRALGSVVLRIDPRAWLYPFLRRWPVPSRTAETLLARRDGTDVLFLNPLRFAPDAALTLRFPLTQTDLPAVRAALGEKGIVEGHDYRGVFVVSAIGTVPGSPWVLIGRIDYAELYAPLQERLWLTVVVLVTILVGATATSTTLWRRQQRARRLALLQEEVEHSRLLRLFYDLPFIGMARISPDTTHFLQFNDRLCDIVGYPREELERMRWGELTHPQDFVAETAEFGRIARGDANGFTVDERFVRKDGATAVASVDVKCVRRADGAADYLIAMVHDITERTVAEEAVRQEQAFSTLVMEHLPGIFYLYTYPAIELVLWNKQHETLLGRDAGGMKGRLATDWFEPHVKAAVSDFIDGVMDRGFNSIEAPMVAQDGHLVPLYLTGVKFENQGQRYFLGIGTDISERQAAEAQLRRTLSDLERSNRDLEQFAYVASHDLQEPLRMVSSFTQLLAQRYEGQLDTKAQMYIHYAVDGAVRMHSLVNDLLAYSRVGSRGQPLQSTDAHAVLGEATRNLAAAIRESQAVITTDDLPTVLTDASQFLLVFQNLIANAIKFRGTEAPRVHVSARESQGEWVFAVKDNGIGIEAQHAERIFVIFQRLHTRGEYPGTGIGLAVCQRIVERHGGRIWVESQPGLGSTFFFTVPRQLATPV